MVSPVGGAQASCSLKYRLFRAKQRNGRSFGPECRRAMVFTLEPHRNGACMDSVWGRQQDSLKRLPLVIDGQLRNLAIVHCCWETGYIASLLGFATVKFLNCPS